ncbi:phosphatidylinositol mannoside acyltransferase [Aldersonia kunmingensis]|uniref:phosphatidylinositol mannoside acyltransferase n=1 Tax=Aldersonia kunmingensis TaxID=408066 RepID=UPI00082E03B1|nr:phosphatidylinositol mannoside acyltransferase [Aldersonia kunmingensis]
MNLRERLSDLGYAGGWRLVRAVPEGIAREVFERSADYGARGGGPIQLRRNLARVLGVTPAEVPEELITASVRSYARYWREAFRLPSMDPASIGFSGRHPVANVDILDAALARGRGAVLALPHSGNWDMAGVWLVQNYGSFSTVAERLKPESLFERFVAYREGLGFEVFPLTGGQAPPFGQLADRLRDNKIVCLLGERDLTNRGVPVDFFGERTRMPAGPAKLAMETGAALLPVHAWFTHDENGREAWGTSIYPDIDVSLGVDAATQALADVFAENIAAHPEDWHMLQPLWFSDLSDERRARLSGEGEVAS